MSNRDALFKQHIKAMAFGQAEKAVEFNSQIDSEDRDAQFVFASGMFAGAMMHKLGEQPSLEEIKNFVDEVLEDYRKADPPLKPLAMEGLVRALYGEDSFLDEIPQPTQMQYQYLVVRKVVDQSPEMQEQLEDYMHDALMLVSEWEAQ